MHLDISLENSETCHFHKGEGQAFYMAIKNANRKTLLYFAPFWGVGEVVQIPESASLYKDKRRNKYVDNKNILLKNQWGVMELDS